MKNPFFLLTVGALAALATSSLSCGKNTSAAPANPPVTPVTQPAAPLKHIVINEAVHTLLYLPLYHAAEKGYFQQAGLQVEIITGGTATNSFAAMLKGDADFSQADPMYVPISREKGGATKVVAQVVGRIAVWGIALDPKLKDMSAGSLRGKTISTHPKPMTAYTYTLKRIQDDGLRPDKDVQVLTSAPGTETVALLNHKADYAMTLEPNVSKAVSQGAHVVYSYPQALGDQVFTGLMTREQYIKDNPQVVASVVQGYQKALEDIRADPEGAVKSAKKYFPQLDESVLKAAITHMLAEEVLPKSVVISEKSWNSAISVRVKAGDLKAATPVGVNCDLQIMQQAAKH